VVAPISEAWVNNVGYLVEVEKFFQELTPEATDAILSEVHAEMVAGYVSACKKSIVDYVLKAPSTRARALVGMVPVPVPDWGSVPFVGIEGTFGGPPDEWRAGIEQNREAVARCLEICGQSPQRLLQLWYHDSFRFAEMLLVDLPAPSTDLVDIDYFFKHQQARCANVVKALKTQWFEDVCSTLKKENLDHHDNPDRFFQSAATLLSIMTRSVVSQSVGAFVNFFQRFANQHPLTPQQVAKLKDTDEREDAFLTVKLTGTGGARGDEVSMKNAPDEVRVKILQIFRDFVVCLNEVKNPEATALSGQRGMSVNKERFLWSTSLDEEYVQQAEKFVEGVVVDNMANISDSLQLYEPFTHLLTEEAAIAEFVQDQSKTIDQYVEKFKSAWDKRADKETLRHSSLLGLTAR
jgi:hypothetical protein